MNELSVLVPSMKIHHSASSGICREGEYHGVVSGLMGLFVGMNGGWRRGGS
jgi:hypothetical protein